MRRRVWIGLALIAALSVTLYAQGVLRITQIEWTSISGTRSGVLDLYGAGTPEGGVVAEPGSVYRDTTNGKLYLKETGSGNEGWVEIGSGSGDVVGPASSTDGALATYDDTTGKLLTEFAGDDCATPGDFADGINADGTLDCDTPAGGGGGTAAIGVVVDGGGSAITTGFKGCSYVPYAGTITAATIISHDAASPTSGSIVIDVWVDDFASFVPTDADSITASAPPTLSSDTASTDATLTGWTTSFSAGDVFCYNVDSVTDAEKITLTLTVTKS